MKKLVEWKTIDLLNNIEKYSCCYSFRNAVVDVTRAIIEMKLDHNILIKMASKFGNDTTKSILENVIIREDQKEYLGNLYYFQPNGTSCFLYANKEDVGDKTKKVHSPLKKSVKKYASCKTLQPLSLEIVTGEENDIS